jgi:hypothetical protein
MYLLFDHLNSWDIEMVIVQIIGNMLDERNFFRSYVYEIQVRLSKLMWHGHFASSNTLVSVLMCKSYLSKLIFEFFKLHLGWPHYVSWLRLFWLLATLIFLPSNWIFSCFWSPCVAHIESFPKLYYMSKFFDNHNPQSNFFPVCLIKICHLPKIF